jgi:transposase
MEGAVTAPADDLLARVAHLECDLAAAVAARDQYKALYEQLREECEKLKRGLLGQKAERVPTDDRQLTLALLETLLAQHGAPELVQTEKVRAHERQQPRGRQPLPAHLPRVDVELIPFEVQQGGLAQFRRIGEEVSEVLERRRASSVVVRVIRPKFVAKDAPRQGPVRVLIGDPADLPILRGRAGPGMLADTIVRRWQDHQPLHRLERIYARDGLVLARSTLCGWHGELATLARPIVEAMHAEALQQPYLCTDATGVLVQAPEQCRHGHFWVLIAPALHVLFRYSPRHTSAAVDQLLAGYQGFLVADAHAVYDHLFVDGHVVEVGCWSHLRRYWFKTLGSAPEQGREALAMIGALFAIERSLVDATPAQRHGVRSATARPIVQQFFAWCADLKASALDETPLAKAIGYATNHQRAFEQFLDDGRLPIHNNWSELQLRRQVIGRRNWLFVGSDAGAEVNTVFVSLLASCGLHQLEPWTYLRDLFCLLPGWPKSRVLDLAPAYWKKTLEDDDTQKRLADNPFRSAIMALDRLHPDDP